MRYALVSLADKSMHLMPRTGSNGWVRQDLACACGQPLTRPTEDGG